MKISLLILVSVFRLFFLGFSSNFNYEIGARVKEKVADYLLLVSKGSSHPNTILQAGIDTINLVDPLNDASTILYPSIIDFGSYVSSMYVGLEGGIYYSYSIGPPIQFSWIEYNKITKNSIWKESTSLYVNGNPKAMVISNSTYNVNGRPWYVQGKLKQVPLWSKPYLNNGDFAPVITFVKPIFNHTINGVRYNFTGLTAADIFLTDINTFLQNTYKDSDNLVFIIDSETGNLIGNSWGASTSVVSNSEQSFVLAVDSSDETISGATATLIKNGYSDNLIIYRHMYLQCNLYTDAIEGIAWYIVVLSPATLQVDHVGPESIVYSAVLSISIITILIVIMSGCITISYWKSRMMQLTQPFFTIVVLGGCLLLCISCMVFLGSNTTTSCAARAFLLNLALTLAFAPLLIKCWRVYILFVKSWKVGVLLHGTQKKLITVPTLILFVICFLLVDAIIAVVTLYGVGSGTDPYTTTLLTTNGAYGELTYCGFHDNNTFFYAELVYKALQVVISSYLVFSIRNVADAVAGTKVLMGIVYNTAFFGALIIGISRSVSYIELVVMCLTVGICFCVIITCMLLVLPVMYRILVIGDKEAAAEVIDEMFKGKQVEQQSAKGNNTHDGGSNGGAVQSSQIIIDNVAASAPPQISAAERNRAVVLGLGNISNSNKHLTGGGHRGSISNPQETHSGTVVAGSPNFSNIGGRNSVKPLITKEESKTKLN